MLCSSFTFMGLCIINISKHNQQDATLHNFFFSWRPLAGFTLLAYEVSWSRTTTRHSRYDSSERMISPSQKPLPDNTQHSQQTNIHALGGIRTHNLSRRAAKDLCLRPRGHWDRQTLVFITINALHVSGGSSAHHQELKTLYTASGICRAFTASCRYREWDGTGLRVLHANQFHLTHDIGKKQ